MSGLVHECIIDLLDSDSDFEDDGDSTTTIEKLTTPSKKGGVPLATRRSKRLRTTSSTTTTIVAAATASPCDSVSIGSSDDDNDDDESSRSSVISNNSEKIKSPPKVNHHMSLMERLQQRKRGLPPSPCCSGSSDDDDEGDADDDDIGDILATVSMSPHTSSDEISITNKKRNTKQKKRCTGTKLITTTKNTNAEKSTTKTNNTKKIAAETNAYLAKLRASVKKRTFPLHQIPKSEIISTGRTIKKMTAWNGHWPPLREFLQNTIDHLGLLDGKTGRRRACIDFTVTTEDCGDDGDGNGDGDDDSAKTKTIFKFSCGNQTICAIHVSPDELLIDQSYTYPIASRALDTGVPDTTKDNRNPNNHNDDGGQAGGFGDGFKTAAVALIANSAKAAPKRGRKKVTAGTDFKALKWYFYARKERIEVKWKFEGLTRESVATFAKCDVLQVKIQKRVNIDATQWRKDELYNDSDDDNDNTTYTTGANEEGQQYLMRQVIQVKGIGTSFIQDAIPRFVVFWDLDEPSLLSTITPPANSRRGGGDFIGLASSQPPLVVSGRCSSISSTSSSLRPCCGVYVRGIYVRPTKIKDTIMCFFGNRLEVTGRDRNEVEQDCLVDAVVHVLRQCSDMDYLRRLLEPLRGRRVVVDRNDDNNDDNSDDDGILASCTSTGAKSKVSKRRRLGGGGGGRSTKWDSKPAGNKASWLLQTPIFFNRVIELEKDFILYNVLQIPKGAIFVSSKTTGSKDPFIQWAASFLQKNGAPLVPIEKGANRYLFEEVNESELTDRCVQILLQSGGSSTSSNDGIARKFFHRIFMSMGIGRAKVHFFPDVKIAFVHYASIFIPEVTHLTRDLIVRVLNICNSHIEGVDAESYSCLMQAVFEILPTTVATAAAVAQKNVIEVADAVKVVNRAKTIRKEIDNFLSNPMGGGDDAPVVEQPARKKRSIISSSSTQDLTMLDDTDDEENNVNKSTSTTTRSERTLPPPPTYVVYVMTS